MSSDLLFFSSTFHSVYISTNRFNHVSPLNKLPLHSTLFILVRWRKISWCNQWASTFHSVYISTIIAIAPVPPSSSSTFHSVYISTYLLNDFEKDTRFSTFHSVYISTNSLVQQSPIWYTSTFHSVYISTKIFHNNLLNFFLYIPLCLY